MRLSSRVLSFVMPVVLIALSPASLADDEAPAAALAREAGPATTASKTPEPAVPSTTRPEPSEEVRSSARFAWFYKPPTNVSASELAARFDVIVLTRNDESFRDELKAANPSLQVLQYVLANEIQHAGDRQPWRNQVAWTTGDAASLLVDHPDWFARDDRGQPLTKSIGDGRTVYVMNPAVAGWTDHLATRALAHNIEAGWDGLFLDNVEMSLSKRRREGAVPAGFASDAAWRDAFVGHVGAIHRAFAASGRPVWANVIEGGETAESIELLAPHLEGTMDESFGTGWDGRPKTGDSWERDLAAVESRSAQGDHSLLVAQGARADEDALQFAFASYLLVSGPFTSFRYGDHREAYAEAWWYDTFDRTIGQPIGPRIRLGETWIRDFDGGRITVDPSAGTASIG